MKNLSVRNPRDTLTAQLHQLVSNRSDKQMNDRNHRACSHDTLLNFAVSLFGRRHSESIDATKMRLRYGTSKFL